MKKCICFFNTCLLLFLFLGISQAQIIEGFEATDCDEAYPFYTGCFPDWINTNGSADIYSSGQGLGVQPYEGQKYVYMYVKWLGAYCSDISRASQTEGIALNYNFLPNTTYTISFALRWNTDWRYRRLKMEWILTNGLINQSGPYQACAAAGVTPGKSPEDQTVLTLDVDYSQESWMKISKTFTTGNENFSQLWFRSEVLPKICCETDDHPDHVFLDDFELIDCSSLNFSSWFQLAAASDVNGNVSVSTVANPNPIPVGHFWDVFFAPNGSTKGNNEVPGNPTQFFNPTAFFDQNMVVNTWYYVKHGIYNLDNCPPWRETRRRFRVQVKSSSSGKPEYELQVEDVNFEPTPEYLDAMADWASSQENLKSWSENSVVKTEVLKNNITLRNFPNPFSGETTLEFALEEEEPVTLFITDLTGKQIEILLNKVSMGKGIHQVKFDADDYPTGIYYYTLKTTDHQETKKMIIIID